ncbi:MAG TPA: GDP-mannose 4,6-dehydratase [Silvibacterium sp.]|nr:GDP-mannose 4,6-dehydratase [Silvibacterium sp.]
MKNESARIVLITGGAGFIGSNLAERLLSEPDTRVRLFDNFSRSGVMHNLKFLRSLPGSSRLEVIKGDVRDARAVQEAASGVSDIFHLAAQVAVTTSVDDPATDFAINAGGTLNVLEAARLSGRKPFVLYTSSNKVYGSLKRLSVNVEGTHYRASLNGFRGVAEGEPLDFHSPYGCSKGTADQYVHDYARIYDLPTVVFRMSCIAGPRQFGNEDQGWVAHFLYSVLNGKPITVYGDGYQVRDILHVHDLIDAMIATRRSIERTRGQVFNLGGGMERAVSVVEMLHAIEHKTGKKLRLRYSAVRPGDQPLYISNTSKLEQMADWRARRSIAQILDAIQQFWLTNHDNLATFPSPRLEPAAALKMEVA